MFPHTAPWAIRGKTRIIGANLTYRTLAFDYASWEFVLKGVRSGDTAWLKVASGLRPALATHQGEEMIGAVSTVLDQNAIGALQILLPLYGPGIICGYEEEKGVIDQLHAERRALLLKGYRLRPNARHALTSSGESSGITIKARSECPVEIE
jgi:hypothetical protein